jgi:hypothetical protein
MNKLHEYLLEIQPEVFPKSPEGRAVRYALKNWTALTRYSEDGSLKIDNNGTERTIRGIAVGRGNWVSFGSDNGGRTAAVLRSFVASSQRAGVDPFAWFKDVFLPVLDSRVAAQKHSQLQNARIPPLSIEGRSALQALLKMFYSARRAYLRDPPEFSPKRA